VECRLKNPIFNTTILGGPRERITGCPNGWVARERNFSRGQENVNGPCIVLGAAILLMQERCFGKVEFARDGLLLLLTYDSTIRDADDGERVSFVLVSRENINGDKIELLRGRHVAVCVCVCRENERSIEPLLKILIILGTNDSS
jgi:hypothetical protein